MKILSLRFLNLNSLKNEWYINFETPEFTEDSLFLISGPTGAGKTTILDAICLALYHRTPRLKSLSKESNELMTRHTGLCFAEVTFITGGKKYRSRWEHHRAGKKSSGSLQPPRCELCFADSGEIITTKLSDKLKQIEEICGLNFERFTRSILLAQGNFTAFLKADKKKKAELLEEITGTEIYGQVSILAFRRMRTEEELLNQLKAEIDGADILSEEKLKEINDTLKDKNTQIETLEKEGKAIEQKSLWLQLIEKLKSDKEQASKDLKLAEGRLDEHKNDFLKLDKAIPALHLYKLYEQRQAAKSKLKHHKQRITESDFQLKKLQSLLKNESTSFKAESEKFTSLQENKTKQEELIHHKVMPLDQEIASREAQVQEPAKKLTSLEEDLQKKKKKLQENKAKRKQLSHYLENLKTWLEQHKHFKMLESNLPLLLQLNQTCHSCEKNIIKGEKDLKRYTQISEQLKNELNASKKTLQNQQNSLLELSNKQAKSHEEFKNNKSATLLESSIQQENKKNLLIQILIPMSLKLRDLSHLINQKRRRLQSLQSEHQKLSKQLPKFAQILKDKETILTQSRVILEKNRIIQDLQVYRDKLQASDPCMVCGSTEHPAIKEYSSLTSHKEQNTCEEAEQDLLKAQRELIGIQKDCEKSTETISSLNIEIEKEEKAYKGESKKWLENCTSLQVKLDPQDEKQISSYVKSFNLKLEELSAQLKYQTKLEKELNEINTQILHRQNSINKTTNETKILEERIKNGAIKTQDLIDTIASDKKTLSEHLQQISELLPSQIIGTSIDERLATAKQSILLYQKEATNEQNSNLQLKDITHLVTAQTNAISELENLIKDLKHQVHNSNEQIRDLKEKRLSIFAKKSTKYELAQLQESFKKASVKLEENKQHLDSLQNNESSLLAQHKELLNTAESLSQDTEKYTQDFKVSLKDSDFKTEGELLKDILKEEEIKLLEKLRQEIKEKLTICSTRFKDLELQLQQELDKKLTEESTESLLKNRELIKNEQEVINSEKNDLLFTLREQTKLKKQLSEKAIKIEIQQNKFNLWATLSSLIGSADGQAFRNFAQGLTLDHLITLANVHLERLHDRYFLARQNDDNLSLNIIDTYQAEAIRPVETLSGGESFLVSLALALALSDLASDRINIESLFLDEGFGTLDPETLETALNALDHLQASGRMIGVISHVQSLKERIPSTIQLYVNEGMGVSQLDEKFAVKSKSLNHKPK